MVLLYGNVEHDPDKPKRSNFFVHMHPNRHTLKYKFFMKLLTLIPVISFLLLTSCRSLNEREKLLQHCKDVHSKSLNRALSDKDYTQMGMNIAAHRHFNETKHLLYQAAAHRLHKYPEQGQKIIEELYDFNREVQAVLKATDEFTDSDDFAGSIDGMQRSYHASSMIIRQINILLADDDSLARWQRIKDASSLVAGFPLQLRNGRGRLPRKLHNTDTVLLAEMHIDRCISHKGSDYAILTVDWPYAASSESLTTFLVVIKDKNIVITQQLTPCYVAPMSIGKNKLLIQAENPDGFPISITLDLSKRVSEGVDVFPMSFIISNKQGTAQKLSPEEMFCTPDMSFSHAGYDFSVRHYEGRLTLRCEKDLETVSRHTLPFTHIQSITLLNQELLLQGICQENNKFSCTIALPQS